jgi:hypothetical protein
LPALPEEPVPAPAVPVEEVAALEDDVALATLVALAPPAPLVVALALPDDDEPDEPAPPSGWAVSSEEQPARSVVTMAQAPMKRS